MTPTPQDESEQVNVFYNELLRHIKVCEEGDAGAARYACMGCDMGGAGYSSKGDGFHDDDCFLLQAKAAIDRLKEELSNAVADRSHWIEIDMENAKIIQRLSEEISGARITIAGMMEGKNERK